MLHQNNTNYEWANVYNKANRTDVERYLSENRIHLNATAEAHNPQTTVPALSPKWPRTLALS